MRPCPTDTVRWAPGFWEYRDRAHVWVPGHWVGQRRGYHWVPDRWDQRRFKLPVAIGELILDAAGVSARIVELTNAGRSLAYALLRFGACGDDAAVNR